MSDSTDCYELFNAVVDEIEFLKGVIAHLSDVQQSEDFRRQRALHELRPRLQELSALVEKLQ